MEARPAPMPKIWSSSQTPTATAVPAKIALHLIAG
jgi:hypothetical protein